MQSINNSPRCCLLSAAIKQKTQLLHIVYQNYYSYNNVSSIKRAQLVIWIKTSMPWTLSNCIILHRWW